MNQVTTRAMIFAVVTALAMAVVLSAAPGPAQAAGSAGDGDSTHLEQALSPGGLSGQSDFVGINPVRMMDTRGGAPVAAGTTRSLRVSGRDGVPAGERYVSMNVTVTAGSQPGFLTVYPCRTPRPPTSNLNYVAGQTVPNAVISAVSTDGEVCFYTSGTTHIVVDVNGYLPTSGKFSGLIPGRAADTRSGQGVRAGLVPAGTTLEVPMARYVPTNIDAVSVVLNVTVTEPRSAGWLVVYPCGEELPFASNLNFLSGQTVPNAVLSAVGDDRSVCIYTSATTHVVVDYSGAFGPSPSYVPFAPERAFDSREDFEEPLYAGETLAVTVPYQSTAVSMNVTATQAGGAGFVTVYPCDKPRPTASNLNYLPGQTVPNAVISPVAADRSVCLYTSADTHLIVDMNGIFR